MSNITPDEPRFVIGDHVEWTNLRGKRRTGRVAGCYKSSDVFYYMVLSTDSDSTIPIPVTEPALQPLCLLDRLAKGLE